MLNFKHYFLLKEGGAGGHMYHPIDLPEVKTGKDLVDIFYKTASYLANTTVPLKIDGVNASIRLVDTPQGKQFAIYRGAKKDIEGPPATIDYLPTRFPENQNFVRFGTEVLKIFNASIQDTAKELKQLGLYDDPLVFFNMEYVDGATNVIGYVEKFLAIHYTGKVVEALSAVKKTKTYENTMLPYNSKLLNAYVAKVNKFANPANFKVIHQIATKLTGTPDFKSVLESPLTIANETKPLSAWLSRATNPNTKTITLTDGKVVGGSNQALYIAVAERGEDLTKLVAPKSLPTAINDIIFWQTTRLMGKALLDVMTSELGNKASEQEGIVINTPTISDEQFKVTGDFFIRNQMSAFRKPAASTPLPSVKTAVVTYGRFNPPTIGHQALIKTLLDTGSKNNAQLIAVFPTYSHDSDKNPLDYNTKVDVLKQVLPNNVLVMPQGKTLFEMLRFLNEQGYKKVFHIAGSDRLPEFEKIVNTYNNKPDKQGRVLFNIPEYIFVSAGERDPDSEGVAGMSASKVRQAAQLGNFEAFRAGMAKTPTGTDINNLQNVYNIIKGS
jgi:hypothetical protein